ncbi:MAG: pantetheine-phosphate adenylyltransferase [Candidatus Lokiarchaeota archaeon]
MLNLVGLGGTFDHLHKGHKLLIHTALKVSDRVVIGLTSEKLLKNKKYFEKIETYEEREKNINEYIKQVTDPKRVQIIELNDPFGPPIHDSSYEGIVVSQETYNGALNINEIRNEKGFKPLIIIVVPIIKDKENKKINSTSIREKIKY